MFALLLPILLACLLASVQAGPYGLRNYYRQQQYQYPTAYQNNNYYQGYRAPYQYQYQNNYYAQPQPTYSQPTPLGLGINYDSHGNSYIGTKENGIYLFCNGRGCPGRG